MRRDVCVAAALLSLWGATCGLAQVDQAVAFSGLRLSFREPPVGRVDGREAYIVGFADEFVRVADERKKMTDVPTSGVGEVWINPRLSWFPQDETVVELARKVGRVDNHRQIFGTYSEDLYVRAAINPGAFGSLPEPGDEPEPVVAMVSDPEPEVEPPPEPDVPDDELPQTPPEPAVMPPPKAQTEAPAGQNVPNFVWAVVAAAGMFVLMKLIR